ncbi:hypothetical protein NP493_47g06039 [Ridgeia piscesae]|uniref:RH1 domain-containing protein n=1 Tax=Ridgeia piscesae TaxID=27915 RepID=A0AAD9PBP0_RIDPI|nr:hypothetical protein NP493_47g06039 [Ridgeia piscesae]
MPTQMESPTNGLHVVDVYDMAISIGKEFEMIIDKYGSDVLAKLMPQVILVLEHLESLAGRSQKENDEIADLKRTIERLQAERTTKENQRERHERVSIDRRELCCISV